MEEEYILTESTKALVDALASGGDFPPSLVKAISLLGQIEMLEKERGEITSELQKASDELTRYKAAYKKIKVEKDNLTQTNLELENRISDLTGKTAKVASLVEQLKQKDGEIQSLKAKLSTRSIDFNVLYQTIKALFQSKSDVFRSTSPKVIEIRVTTESQPAKGFYVSFDYENPTKPNQVLSWYLIS